jgi:hypothetical protein
MGSPDNMELSPAGRLLEIDWHRLKQVSLGKTGIYSRSGKHHLQCVAIR